MQISNFVDFEKMLKNAPTLAIGGADTAENGPSKVRQVSNKIRRILDKTNWEPAVQRCSLSLVEES